MFFFLKSWLAILSFNLLATLHLLYFLLSSTLFLFSSDCSPYFPIYEIYKNKQIYPAHLSIIFSWAKDRTHKNFFLVLTWHA